MDDDKLANLRNRMGTARLSTNQIILLCQAIEFAMDNRFFDECSEGEMALFEAATGEL